MTTATKRRNDKKTTFSITPEQLDAMDNDADAELLAIRKGKSRAKPLPTNDDPDGVTVTNLRLIDIASIVDSPFQTREEPSKASIEKMAASLAKDGQRDPIRVRVVGENFELLAGHRRTRAARSLGWPELAAVIVQADDAKAAFEVFDDNEQREDLNPIERAKGLKVILDQYQAAGRSMRQMAEDLGIAQGTISNRICLVDVPASLSARLISGEITESQLRLVPQWLKYAGFLERFEKQLGYIDDMGDDRIANADWYDAITAAIESISRPTKKRSTYQISKDDPAFNVDGHADDLDIVEISLPGRPKGSRCMNVELWEQLQKDGKKKQKEQDKKKAEKQATTTPAAATRQRTNRDSWAFRDAMNDAWKDPIWRGIGVAISGKLTKPQQAQAVRLLFLILEDVETEFVVKALSATPDEFVAAGMKLLRDEWDDGMPYRIEMKHLRAIGEHYGVDVVSTWKPTRALLDACELIDLQELAEGAGIGEYATKADLVSRLLDNWVAGDVPELFSIEPPKPARKAKTAKGKA